MKTTTKQQITTLFMTIALMLGISVYAQQAPRGGERQGPPPIPDTQQINEMVNHLSQELSLTKEQKADILELFTAHFTMVKEKMEAERRAKKEEMDAIKNDFECSIKELLTKEQQQKFEVFTKEHEKNRPQGPKHK